MSTVQHLPVEVLLRVFHYFVGARTNVLNDKDGPSRRWRPVFLTHVCPTWRSCALGDPSLWIDVQIYGISPLFLSFIERSRPLLFDLTVVATVGPNIVPTQVFLGRERQLWFKADLERVRSLNIWSVNHEAAEYTVGSTVGSYVDLPALRSLGVYSCSISDYYQEHQTYFLRCLEYIRAPALESFICNGMTVDHILSRSPIRGVKKLEIYRINWHLDHWMLRRIVTDLPQLDTLIIGRWSIPDVWHFDRVTEERDVVAPSLKNLAIASPIHHKRADAFGQPCVYRCLCTVRTLVAENLEYLEVTGSDGEALIHLENVIQQRFAHSTRPLTVFLNGAKVSTPQGLLSFVPRYLLQVASHIHLQLYPETPWSVEEASQGFHELDVFSSFVLHFPKHMHHVLPSNKILPRFPVLDDRLPLLISSTHAHSASLELKPQYLDLCTMEEKFRDYDSDIDETEENHFEPLPDSMSDDDYCACCHGPTEEEIMEEHLKESLEFEAWLGWQGPTHQEIMEAENLKESLDFEAWLEGSLVDANQGDVDYLDYGF